MSQLYIFEQGGDFDFYADGKTKLAIQVGDYYLFERDKKILCLKPITKILWQLVFWDKYSFDKLTPDFPNKDYFFYYYKLWPELKQEQQEIDLDIYKC